MIFDTVLTIGILVYVSPLLYVFYIGYRDYRRETMLRELPKYEVKLNGPYSSLASGYILDCISYDYQLRNTNIRSYVERKNMEEHITLYNLVVI